MKTKYLNDGIIGNGKLTASFNKNGELLRLFYGSADYKQFLEEFYVGVKINDSNIVYLNNDINNIYNQKYIDNTNILQTEIFNSYFNLQVTQTDFVPISENILIKKYKFTNNNSIDLNIDLLAYSIGFKNINNDTCGFFKEDMLVQYNHDYSVCIFSKADVLSCQINGSSSSIETGRIGGKDYIGMSADSAISYSLNLLKPGESKEIDLYIYINDNNKMALINELDTEINRIRKINTDDLFDATVKYWKKYIKEFDTLNIDKNIEDDKIKKIYTRTILLLALLINNTTGGISAGVEVDEEKTKCGRYSYCWTRDAVFITKAMDILGMKDNVEKFYEIFCKKTQSKSGRWEQRFYTDCKLAPCWGYQIDETASVIYGVCEHFKIYKDKIFLKNNLKMCENAVDYLQKYVEDIFKNKNLIPKSYDLWEENEGESLYAFSSIFSAYNSMLEIYENVKVLYEDNRLRIEQMNKRKAKLESGLIEIKEYCTKHFFDENKKCFVRNVYDRKIDISLLGSVVPFKMFSPKEKYIENTIERIDMTLRTYTGGYVRYEEDRYMGGFNPWVIANLWMACYDIEIGENKKALENFMFVTKTCTEHGFLGEQINNETMQPAWIIGLTWSHAMYIIVLEKLMKKGLI